jgi:hypothetical protein
MHLTVGGEDAMSDAVEKYEAWAGEIQKQLATFAKLRRDVRFFPLFALLTAPFGLFWAPWLGVAVALVWLTLWGTTLYITTMRTWQYENELALTRAELSRLQGRV